MFDRNWRGGDEDKLWLFINYRRNRLDQSIGGKPSAPLSDAEELRNRLVNYPELKRWELFLDTESLPAGQSWRIELDQAVDRSTVMIVLIGPDWLTVQNEKGERRIDDPMDVLRCEIKRANDGNKIIVPVYTGGAMQLRPEQLPSELQVLAGKQSLSFDRANYDKDARRIADVLVKIEKEKRAKGIPLWLAGLSAGAAAALGATCTMGIQNSIMQQNIKLTTDLTQSVSAHSNSKLELERRDAELNRIKQVAAARLDEVKASLERAEAEKSRIASDLARAKDDREKGMTMLAKEYDQKAASGVLALQAELRAERETVARYKAAAELSRRERDAAIADRIGTVDTLQQQEQRHQQALSEAQAGQRLANENAIRLQTRIATYERERQTAESKQTNQSTALTRERASLKERIAVLERDKSVFDARASAHAKEMSTSEARIDALVREKSASEERGIVLGREKSNLETRIASITQELERSRLSIQEIRASERSFDDALFKTAERLQTGAAYRNYVTLCATPGITCAHLAEAEAAVKNLASAIGKLSTSTYEAIANAQCVPMDMAMQSGIYTVTMMIDPWLRSQVRQCAPKYLRFNLQVKGRTVILKADGVDSEVQGSIDKFGKFTIEHQVTQQTTMKFDGCLGSVEKNASATVPAYGTWKRETPAANIVQCYGTLSMIRK